MKAPTYKRAEATRGECYANVLNFLFRNRKWTAVHGIPLGQGPIAGVRYGHAWAEIDHEGLRWVYDPSADALLPAAVYYAVGRIEYTVRYEYHELAARAVESGHSGPWDATVNAAKSKETL